MTNKAMTTHELAKMLLESEDKPLYFDLRGEHMGERYHIFYGIKGLSDTVVEGGYVFDTEHLKEQPNSNFYKKGDAKVFMVDEHQNNKKIKIEIEISDLVYMMFAKAASYHSYKIDSISFYEDENFSDATLLEREVEVVLEDGFHPKTQLMSFEEAQLWYEKEFPQMVEDYKAEADY